MNFGADDTDMSGTAADAAAAAWETLVRLTGPVPVASAGPTDWDRVIDLAIRHKSVSLLARGLGATGAVGLSAAATDRLAAVSRERAKLTLNLAHTAAVLARAMVKAGLSASMVKGAPLSQAIHGDIAARDPGDIDFLLPPEQMAAAADVMARMGFRADYPHLLRTPRQRARLMRWTNQIAFFDPALTMRIELHWRWQKSADAMPTDPVRACGQRVTIPGMGEVRVPDGTEHFIFLCAHGLAHEWMRLKWLNDIRWTLHDGRLVQGDWAAVAARARDIGMATAVAAAAVTAQRIDGGTLPDPLGRLVQDYPRAGVLADRTLTRMLECAVLTDDPPERHSPMHIARTLLHHDRATITDRPRSRFDGLKVLFTPSPPELSVIDLPRGLGAGYMVIRGARMLRRVLSPKRPDPAK